MKRIILLMLLVVSFGCGDSNSCKSSDYICHTCTKDGDCCGNTCVTIYSLANGMPLGKYCLDTADRICSVK